MEANKLFEPGGGPKREKSRINKPFFGLYVCPFFTHFQWSNFKSNHRFGILASVIAVLSKIVHNAIEADVIKTNPLQSFSLSYHEGRIDN